MHSDVRAFARNHGAPLGIFIALVLLMTWPLALNFTAAVPGDGVDNTGHMWNMWWLKYALLHGQNPFSTRMIFYPEGVSLWLHTLNLFNFLISLPFQMLFGLIVAYNAAIIFALATGGYTAYLLAVDVTDDRRAALVAGVIYGFSGYVLAQVIGHHNLMAVQWLPVVVLALRRVTRGGGRLWIGVAALALWFNLLCDWQYFLFAMIWGGWYALTVFWERRSLRAVAPVGAALALGALLALPMAIPTAMVAAQTPQADTGEAYRLDHSADLLDFAIPSQLHPVWGSLSERWQSYKPNMTIQNKTAYLGFIAVGLAVIGVRRKEGHFWLISALVFAVLALGPHLQVGGVGTGIPLPAALLYNLPLINVSRVPLRFVVLALLALAMLAALGTRQILARFPQPARRNALLAGLVGLIALENLTMPYPLSPIYIAPIYAEMGGDGEQYAILDAPFYRRTSFIHMFYQAVHEKPLVEGHLSRKQANQLETQLPLIRAFAHARPAPDIIGQDYLDIASSVFSYFNIRYILLHSDGGALRYSEMLEFAQAAADGNPPQEQGSSVVYPDARRASTLRRTMGLVELQPSGSALIYEVVPPETPLPFLGIGDGWSYPEAQADGSVQRTVEREADLIVYSAEPRDVVLELHVAPQQSGRLYITRNGADLTAWVLDAGRNILSTPLHVDAGETRFTLIPETTGALAVELVDLANAPMTP